MKVCRLCGDKIHWWQYLTAHRDNGIAYHDHCWSLTVIALNLNKHVERRYSDTMAVLLTTSKSHDAIMLTEVEEIRKILFWLEMNGARRIDVKPPEKGEREYLGVLDPSLIELLAKYTGMEITEILQEIKNKELKRILNTIQKDKKR